MDSDIIVGSWRLKDQVGAVRVEETHDVQLGNVNVD
jgi:hypothetical protein